MKGQSVDELRQILVNSGKFTQEQADSIKGKSKLSQAVLALTGENEESVSVLFDDVEIESELTSGQNTDETLSRKMPPNRLSPEWQDYVLSQFVESELEENDSRTKYPTLVGLRRVAEKLLGEIVVSEPTKLETVIDDRNRTGYSVCVYRIAFDNGVDPKKVFGGAASASSNNTDDEYSVFPEAIAESRAEARALRKALNLKIVSKDELTSKDIKKVVAEINRKEVEKDGNWTEDDEISTIQKMTIEKTCARMNIDPVKLLSQESLGNDVNLLTKKQGANLIELLNKYSSNSKESVVIPQEIKKEVS